MPGIEITVTAKRIGSDVHLKLSLADSGVSIAWDTVEVKQVCMYSVEQKAFAGHCSFAVDREDNHILNATYPASEQLYLGDHRVVVRLIMDSVEATYDALAFTLKSYTDAEGSITTNPVEIGINVEEVDTTIMHEILAACQAATDDALAAESAIAIAEAARVEAEDLRVAAENARAAAETARQNAESLRAAAEVDRAAAENARAAAEVARENAEAERVGQSAADHTRAESDHSTAAADHTRAESDHFNAAVDHSIAAADHTTAEDDHAIVQGYDTRLTNVEGEVSQLGQKVDEEFLNLESFVKGYDKTINITGSGGYLFPMTIKSGTTFRVKVTATGVLKKTSTTSQMSQLLENNLVGQSIGMVADGTTLVHTATTDISGLALYVNANTFLASGGVTLTISTDSDTLVERIDTLKQLQSALITSKTYTLGTATNAYVKASDGSVVNSSACRMYKIDLLVGDYINFKAAVPASVAAISKYNGEGNNYTPIVIGQNSSTHLEYNYLAQEDMTIAVCWANTTYDYMNGFHSDIYEQLFERAPLEVEIILPPEISVVVGHQLTLYHENIIRCDNLENYDIKWSNTDTLNAKAYHEGLRLDPNVATVRNVILKVRDKYTFKDVASKTVIIRAIDEPALAGKRVVFIGDSLTHAAVYPAEVEVLSNGGITSVGTRTRKVRYNSVNHEVSHEGRSGWYPADYVTKASIDGVTNPFYNPSTETFDFSYYVTNNSIGSLDAVCICLGTNGFLGNQESAVSNINTMISSIHAYDASLQVLVSLITPPAAQDGWANMANTRTNSANEMLKLQLDLVKKYITAFGNRNDNVSLVPWYVNVDRNNDFPTTSEPLSSRNPEVVLRENDNVHPGHFTQQGEYSELTSGVGYLKMADSMYYELAKLFS